MTKKKILVTLGIFVLFLSSLGLFSRIKPNVSIGNITSVRTNNQSFNPQLTTCTTGTVPTTTPGFLNTTSDTKILGPFSVGDTDVNTMNVFTVSTTTPARLQYRFELSDNLIDWYPETTELVANAAATTTPISNSLVYPLNMASSTLGTSVFSAPSTTILVQTPKHVLVSRYARVVFSIGSLPGVTMCADINLKTQAK